MADFDPEEPTLDFPSDQNESPADAAHASPVVEPSNHPEHIGRYRIEKVLGEGGFGLVYLAYDEQLNRLVAVKVPHARLVSRPENAEAYLTEARTVANLDHAHIVPVYDVGSTDEFPCYIVSKYVEGTDLAIKLKQSRLKHTEAAELVATVAEALHYAHKQGLVHRDVKTGNILVDTDGKPYVVDFGLALREENIGQGPKYAGTPNYMSPEQARGEGHRVDGRSDIFSLGVVFYELLVGRRPFQADRHQKLMEQITTLEARPPRQIDDGIPKELERICLKALSKRAIDRYTTAKDLADDLRHFQAEQTVIQSGTSPDGIASITSETHASTPTTTSKGSVGGSYASMDLGLGSSDGRPIQIVPKGLRSFDEHDADFFLELLPGPRDREGLPDSIRFWKTHVEEADPDNTFSVGLIYGPSGCGKSSLVKAGLLPRLSDDVIAVSIESTPDETESRLLHVLRKRCPDLADNLGLKETLAALRRGEGVPVGKKVLIVLDQFEQWLNAKRDEENTQLVQSLRQCDGGNVQCIVMVRDDFWMAATRFMRDLEVRLVEAENSAAVDLFPVRHAVKVLAAFGRAFGALPDSSREVNKDQKEFLKQSIDGLAEDGKVICVRLALFAEMMKGKPWTPATLREVGGTEGLGVTFLEDTFSANTAPPQHRYHQKAARALLKALLPESGTNIKGLMRSDDELLEASGYANRRGDFDDLIRILDREIRLITPTDPEGAESEDGKPDASASGSFALSETAPNPPAHSGDSPQYYQLTHDYLVPSLRDWLTAEQHKTWRGRAELRLEELTTQWIRSKDRRFLPSLREYVSFALGVPRAKLDSEKRALMRAAKWRHGVILMIVTLVMTLAGGGAWETKRYLGALDAKQQADLRSKDATNLVRRILAVEFRELKNLIENELPGQRILAIPELRAVYHHNSTDRDQKLRAGLALVGSSDDPVEYLGDQLLVCRIDEFAVIRNLLKPYHKQLQQKLWETLNDTQQLERARFHAGMALANYVPVDADGWTTVDFDFLAEQLLSSNPDYHRELRSNLQPIAHKLVRPLHDKFRDTKQRQTVLVAAARALADFAQDDPELLAELASEATVEQYEYIYPVLKGGANRERAKRELVKITKEQPAEGMSESERVLLGGRRAGAAITLMRLGERNLALDALRVREDPESLTQFVHRLKDRGLQSNVLVKCLLDPKTINESSKVRFGLLLSLGEFSYAHIPDTDRERLNRQLLKWYGQDPSKGVHSAVGWLLRTWDVGEKARQQVIEIDRTPRPYDPSGKREWFVQSIGKDEYMTFLVFKSGNFKMGSPKLENDRRPDENRHDVSITYDFAVSDREVTWRQFKRFWNDQGEAIWSRYNRKWNVLDKPDEMPAIVKWYDSLVYCRWLSGQAGIGEQASYPPPDEILKAARQQKDPFVKDFFRQPGFRLPTEAEWEYACRAGTTTPYSFGNDRSLLRYYAWFYDNTSENSVGRKEFHGARKRRPNLGGLFDVHGNAIEWCHDWLAPYAKESETDPVQPLFNGGGVLVRGGAVHSLPRDCRAARRFQTGVSSTVGFRLVFILPEMIKNGNR
jgi:serine/threonine protein kinase/formylglycine-generating enzyme required for sulfatase activity